MHVRRIPNPGRYKGACRGLGPTMPGIGGNWLTRAWVTQHVGSHNLSEHGKNFSRLGVSSLEILFGKDQLVVDSHLEGATAAGNELQFVNDMLVVG